MRIPETKSLFIVLLAAMMAGLLPSCKKKAPPPPPSAPPVAKAEPTPTPEQPKEKPVYVYSGDRFRDPFTPAGQATNYQPDAVFDPQRAIVRGIIFGTKLQSAVLQVGGTGTYFVRDGRIFDVMGKNIEGYTVKIFKDKVAIRGESDAVYELKLQETEGGKAL
jgi:hypothetical protein